MIASKKSSAITFSIVIMLLLLGVMLGFTAYTVDSATVRPIVLMKDSEVNMRCFLILLSMESNNYLRSGESPAPGSMREELLQTYGMDSQVESLEEYPNLKRVGYSGIFMGDDAQFRSMLNERNIAIECFMRSYGPVQKGFLAIYSDYGAGDVQ